MQIRPPQQTNIIMTKYKYKSFHLDEKAHLDDLVADAVEVRRDELVRVLDHVDEDLDLGLDFVQIRRIRPKQQFHLLLLGRDVTEKEQKNKDKIRQFRPARPLVGQGE